MCRNQFLARAVLLVKKGYCPICGYELDGVVCPIHGLDNIKKIKKAGI